MLITSSKIPITARDGGSFSAYLAVPHAPRGASVVVLQEIFGINANIRSITDDWAAAGYFAIAPDLFWRQQPNAELDPAIERDRETATALLKGLNQDFAVTDALAALDYVRGLPGSNRKAAAVGYCLGGKLAYLLAARSDIDVAVSYYGVGIQGALSEAATIRGKLLLHIAANDHLCPPEAQAALIAAMSSLRDRVTIQTHEAVGHAFARRGGQGFNASAAARADAATVQLLTAELG